MSRTVWTLRPLVAKARNAASRPLPMPETETDFVDVVTTIAGNGDLFAQAGIAIHIFA